MRFLFILIILSRGFILSFAQGDEPVFVIKANPNTSGDPAVGKAVEIYWEWKSPMKDGQEQCSIVSNFRGYPGRPFTYRNIGTIDSTFYNYESLDVRIANKIKSAEYHSNNNRITPEISSAFNKMIIGTTVTFRLNRKTSSGENKTETLVYHIISFARFMGQKRNNWHRINKGLPPVL